MLIDRRSLTNEIIIKTLNVSEGVHMMDKKSSNEWKAIVEPALKSKVEEFNQNGYPKATNEGVWKCLQVSVWKGNPDKHIYEVVQDIMHLSSNQYMSYLTIESYQNEDLFASIAALTQE